MTDTKIKIIQGNNLDIMNVMESKKFNLIYSDPPFNTKKTQSGHGGSYEDSFDNFLEWIRPRIEEAKRLLTNDGSFFIHMDYREIHYVKILCDEIFGRNNFMNEIIWSYDFGARQKKKWSTKHDTILWYVKDCKNYVFNLDQVDLVPKLAPGLPVSKNRKNPHLKMITDVWQNTIVHTNGKERTGYPTQKPLTILERIVKVHSNPADYLLDFFAGSGSFGEAAIKHGRNVTLIDKNSEAILVMKNRLNNFDNVEIEFFRP